MKLKALVAGMALVAMSQGAMAAEPTRGFLLEKGATTAFGNASADASVGFSDDLALRLGLGDAELILARSTVGTAASSGAVVKYSLKQVDGLAVYAGLSQFNQKGDGWTYDYLNIKAGAAFTVKVEQFDLTANAELVLDDAADETYLQIGAGAFLNLSKTAYGTFKPGIEVVASTYDGSDTQVVAGVRWEYSNRLTIDAMLLNFDETDIFSVPGALKVNFAF